MINYMNPLINSEIPNPSVETLLLIYRLSLNHTHSNAFLSILNQPNSIALIKKIFGNKIGIVLYYAVFH